MIDEGHSPAASDALPSLSGGEKPGTDGLVGADGTQARKLVGEEGDCWSVTWSLTEIESSHQSSLDYGYGAKGAIEICDLKGKMSSSTCPSPALFYRWLGGPLIWAPMDA